MSEFTPEGKDSAQFRDLGIRPEFLSVLEKRRLNTPTPIQIQAIPVALAGQDVIGIAQTGTGKTVAFAIPVLQKLLEKPGKVLILGPTRELVMQLRHSMQSFNDAVNIKSIFLIGGEPIERQISSLRRDRPRLIIGTPGRIIDLLKRKELSFSDVHTLVLDEADMMFDMGFEPQINEIIKNVPTERQTMLFSATMPKAVLTIATKHMKQPVHIEVTPPGTANKNVTQEIFMIRRNAKRAMLKEVLKDYKGSVLIFVRTKREAHSLCTLLREASHKAAEIHSDRSLGQRRNALQGFRTGIHRILVATDIAARGIHVSNIELVINYDLPENPEDYVHRIGRAGRAGNLGKAMTFVDPSQKSQIGRLEHLLKVKIPVSVTPNLVLDPADMEAPRGEHKKRAPLPQTSHFMKRRIAKKRW